MLLERTVLTHVKELKGSVKVIIIQVFYYKMDFEGIKNIRNTEEAV